MIRWRTGADLDPADGMEPYWARFDTDDEFAMVYWTPSPFTEDEFMRIIG